MLSKPELIEFLRTACQQAGSQRAWARRYGLAESYVSDVVRGNREPGSALLAALGYRKVLSYEAIEK